MTILFDHQTFSQQNYGGISRYYTELIRGINNNGENKAILPTLYTENIHIRESGIETRSFLPKYSFYKKKLIQYKINQLYTIKSMRDKKFDIYHATYYDPFFLPHVKNHPVVITILDMIHEIFGEKFKELDSKGITTKHKKILANRADRIIAISESTKNDIIKIFGIESDKIDVVHLGSSFELQEKLMTNTSEPYLLFVGRRERYKNFDGLLMAVSTLLKSYDIKLICAGGDPFSNSEIAMIKHLNVEDYLEYRPVNDIELRELYKQAVGFIFPSMYEGFGIPVLEAFACGCPCVLSEYSSLPEVAGDAAVYMNPYDVDSMKNSVKHFLDNGDLRKNLVNRGYDRLNKFSWGKTVQNTIDIYKTLS